MVALSLNCLVTGANEVISVEIDSEKTVLDLKKALQTADPTLIYGHISFVKLYLAKSTPETSKAKWQDVFRLVQNAMRSDQSEESEREGRPQSQRQPCEEMTSGRHLDSFVGIGERVTSAEKEPDVIVQRPDYEDLRNMQRKLCPRCCVGTSIMAEANAPGACVSNCSVCVGVVGDRVRPLLGRAGVLDAVRPPQRLAQGGDGPLRLRSGP